jgi:hypothetical protein
MKSLQFYKSTRASSDPIWASVLCNTNNSICWTIDKESIRLWHNFKLIKSSHFPKQLFQGRSFLTAKSIDNNCLIVLSPKNDSTNGILQIWSSSLILVKQMTLNYRPIGLCTINIARSEIFLVEKSFRFVILQYNSVIYENNEVQLSSSKSKVNNSTEFSLQYSIKEKQKFTLPNVESEIVDIQICPYTSNVVMIDKNGCMHIVSELNDLRLKFQYDETLKVKLLNIESTTKGPIVYEISKTYNLQLLSQIKINPVFLQICNENVVAIAYDNGHIHLVKCDRMITLTEKFPLQTLIEFRVFENIHSESFTSLQKCSWITNRSKMFNIELFTMDSTLKICHWGITYRDTISIENETVTEHLLLGEYKMKEEPESHILQSVNNICPRNLIYYEDQISGIPCKKHIFCTYGSMIAIFEVHEPQRLIQSYIPNASHVSSGPLVSDFFSDDDIPFQNNKTFIISQDNYLQIIDSKSGNIIRGANIPTIYNGIYTGTITCIYCCNHSKNIILGMSTGNVLVLSPMLSEEIFIINSISVHTSEITKISSVKVASSPNSDGKYKEKLYLIVADKYGIMSSWFLRGNESKNTWMSQCHQSQICALHSCECSTSIRIIISACVTGLVNVWVVKYGGELVLISFFKSCGNHLSTLYAIPFIDISRSLISESESSEFSITIVVVCGFLNGMIESWLISNNSSKCASLPEALIKVSNSGITFIGPSFHLNTCGTLQEPRGLYIASCDGLINLIEIDSFGKVSWIEYYTVPFTVRIIMDSTTNSMESISTLIAGDKISCEILNFFTTIPVDWKNKELNSKLKIEMGPDEGMRTEYQNDLNADTSNSESINLHIESKSGIKNALLSQDTIEPENLGDSAEELVITYPQVDSMTSLKYTDPIKSSISAELHFIKKNHVLLELFQQAVMNQKESDRLTNGDISVDEAATIIHKFFGAERHLRENILEVISLLELKQQDRINFLNVAKISAIISSALGIKGLGFASKSQHKQKSFHQLRQHYTRIIYNSMGEKSFKRTELPMGSFNSMVSTIKSIWKDQPCRVASRNDLDLVTFPPTMLRKLPEGFLKLVQKDIELPMTWNPSNKHWFDIRRTIRIARTILDIRSSKQYAAYVNFHESGTLSNVTGLPKILLRYFERNFGTGQLNMAQQKTINYLEACMQYFQYPIINFIRKVLCPTNLIESVSINCLWLYIETRSYLLTRGLVTPAGVITVSGEVMVSSNLSSTSNSKSEVYWLVVRRTDALACIQEMISKRGKYGPQTLYRLLLAVDEVPSYKYNSSNLDDSNDYIDFEQFLEAIAVEYTQIERLINELEHICFGLHSLQQDMNTSHSSEQSGGLLPVAPTTELECFKVFRLIMYQFCELDRDRLGIVSADMFRAVILNCSRNIPGFCSLTTEVYALFEVCKKFNSKSADGFICYLDFWATILAWVAQTRCTATINCSNITKSINEIKRGIDESYAAAIINLIALIQCPVSDNPFWVCASTDSRVLPLNDLSSTSTLNKDGYWTWSTSTNEQDVIVPSPMSIKKVEAATNRISRAEQDKFIEANLQRTKELPIPVILSTNRDLSTVYGEICKPANTSKKSEVPLTINDIAPDFSAIKLNIKDRQSYSRSVNNLTQLTSDPSFELASNSNIGVHLDFKTAVSYNLATNNDIGDNVEYFPTNASKDFEESITTMTETAVERIRLDMISKSAEFNESLNSEKIIMEERLRKKAVEKTRMEKIAKEKYFESMRQKQKFDDLKEKRLEKIRLMENKANELEEADKLAKLEAEKARIAAVKEHQNKQKSERALKEQLENEKHREFEESMNMKQEEQRMRQYMEELAEKLKIEHERAMKKAAAEAEKLRQQQEAERLELERKWAEEEALRLELELKQQMLEIESMKIEDFNILSIKNESILQEVEPEIIETSPPPAEAVEDVPLNTDEDIVIEKEASSLEKKMKFVLEKIDLASKKYLNHPRRSGVKSGNFFFPLSFSNDIIYNPFVTQVYDRKTPEESDSIDVPSGFTDIQDKVKLHKIEVAQFRREQFRVSETGVEPEDWTILFRKDSVDWIKFFKNEKVLLNFNPPPVPAPVDEEKEFLDEMSLSQHNSISKEQHVFNLLDIPDQNDHIEPLPLAKVLKCIVRPNKLNYYQVYVFYNL